MTTSPDSPDFFDHQSTPAPSEERTLGGRPQDGVLGAPDEGHLLAAADELSPAEAEALILKLRRRRSKTRRTIRPEERKQPLTAEQRLLLLDTWLRSKLPAKDFASMVGVTAHTLYKWKARFEEDGPAGLMDRTKGPKKGSRLSELTKRAILMLKQDHPDWGQDRISSMLSRGEGFGASPGAIGRYLAEEGYVVEDLPTKPHPDKKRRFERSRPNELWQTDLFTFVLKRENRRVHLVGYMDDCSRFLVGYGLHATASGALVRESFETAIRNYGKPKEILTDNGAQYTTWRGKSAFTKLCERIGVKQVIASPRRPQTLGKVERFWGTLWQECIESAIFQGIDDARTRIGHFMDYYNFQRPHSGIEGLVPADRFFEAAPQVKETLQARIQANALDLAKDGTPRKSFYLTGRIGDKNLSLHAEGEKVVMTQQDGSREEVDLCAPGLRAEPGEEASMPDPVITEGSPEDLDATKEAKEDPAPGSSPLDEGLKKLKEAFGEEEEA